jgi:hypothetical protein
LISLVAARSGSLQVLVPQVARGDLFKGTRFR